MDCKKVDFDSLKEAKKRAAEINLNNSKSEGQKQKLRAYKCELCNKWHLTKMPKYKYMWKNNVGYRNEIREKKFVERESEYWNRHFGTE